MTTAMSTVEQIKMWQSFLRGLGKSCKCHKQEIAGAQNLLSELLKSGFLIPEGSFLMLPLQWEILCGVCRDAIFPQSKFYLEFDVRDLLKQCSSRYGGPYCIEPRKTEFSKDNEGHVIANPFEVMALARFNHLSRFTNESNIIAYPGVGFQIPNIMPNKSFPKIRIYAKANTKPSEHLQLRTPMVL